MYICNMYIVYNHVVLLYVLIKISSWKKGPDKHKFFKPPNNTGMTGGGA